MASFQQFLFIVEYILSPVIVGDLCEKKLVKVG